MIVAGTGAVVAMAIGGIVAVIGIAAVFYLIGRGEDRDRASRPDGVADAGPRVPGAPGTADYQAKPAGHAPAASPAPEAGRATAESPAPEAGNAIAESPPPAGHDHHDSAPRAKRRPTTSRRRRP